ncbi:hypothetical protein STRDD10_01978 [Streptococcus sp. DD10]|uniref:DUF262 domain-containing protein n=1 Tax=Streptococcus sp. DD10 TaxID=1777878 RepID=UPI000797C26B|nr:DUF262 domain-containing protein [Streptococcus sp. DD10]KXT72331.1 hypothetical protein STRDD10_01978 [Streptococcus sp. DD10]
MVDTHTSLFVSELLSGDQYVIPLYQRNFAWTYDEIEQLLNDVADAFADAFVEEGRKNYYIGTLVVNREGNLFKIIDGQQRTTALNLLALVLKHEFGFDRFPTMNLSFPARKKSNEVIQKLFHHQEIAEEDENELIRGYRHAKEALDKVLKEREFDHQDFFDFLFDKVVIFRSILPQNLDLNLYFERFNSRGEQLEAHEILKAQMMAKFGDDQIRAQKFARIWDACADFDRPVISQFKRRVRPNDSDQEKERLFGKYFNQFNIVGAFEKLDIQKTDRRKLIDSLENRSGSRNVDNTQEREFSNYTAVIDFPTFLLHVLYLMQGSADVSFDDKKLLQQFDLGSKEASWIKQFAEQLLMVRHIFDTFVVKNVLLDSSNETEWQLKRIVYAEENNKKGGWYYVRERDTHNTFEDSKVNQNIILLQSMFAVTFTANRDSRWLYEILQFLFEHIDELHQQDFGKDFRDFLEKMAVRYAESRLFAENGQFRSYGDIPVYAFNFVDYVLWKNRDSLAKEYNTSSDDYKINFNDFKFAYRRSVEHWYPQHPNGEDGWDNLPTAYLHSFGNLCIITDSQNSRFGNLNPSTKFGQWRNNFYRQSLKLQLMAKITEQSGSDWGPSQIRGMENDILILVNKFIESKSLERLNSSI